MRMKQIASKCLGIASLFILVFDCFWYLFKYPDLSSFISFAMVSGLLALISLMLIFIMRMENRLTKFEGEIKYFEDKLLEKFPSLLKEGNDGKIVEATIKHIVKDKLAILPKQKIKEQEK